MKKIKMSSKNIGEVFSNLTDKNHKTAKAFYSSLTNE